MPPRIVLENCRFSDNGIAISIPEGTPLQGSGNVFERNGKALEVRDAPQSLEEARNSLLRALPEGTTWEELREALRQIRAASEDERQQRATRTSIASKLAAVGKWSLETASQIVAIAEYFERRGWL